MDKVWADGHEGTGAVGEIGHRLEFPHFLSSLSEPPGSPLLSGSSQLFCSQE